MEKRWFSDSLNNRPARFAAVASLLALLAGFIPGARYIQSGTGYLPFHSIIETLSVIISSAIFALIWESRTHRSKDTLLLACGFLAVSWLDLVHLLSYAGMPDFVTPSSPQKAINFWLAARLTVAISLLTFAYRSTESSIASNSHCHWQLLATLAYSGIVTWIFLAFPEIIPATYIDGVGLTPFKIGVEWLVITANVVAAILLLRRHQTHHHPFDLWLASAAWVMALAEIFLLFTPR